MRITYDPDRNPDHPAEERWRAFKRKLEDRPGGWPMYLGLMYLAVAVGDIIGKTMAFKIPIWALFGGLGVAFVGYSIVRRGVMG